MPDHEHKVCSICEKSKPLSAYRPKPDGTTLEAACSNCRDKRERTENRTIYNRARQRASQLLIERYPDEFLALIEELKPVVRAEMGEIGGPKIKLRPGARLQGQTAKDRIAEICEDCATYHGTGHKCPRCTAIDRRAAELQGRRQRLDSANRRIMVERALTAGKGAS